VGLPLPALADDDVGYVSSSVQRVEDAMKPPQPAPGSAAQGRPSQPRNVPSNAGATEGMAEAEEQGEVEREGRKAAPPTCETKALQPCRALLAEDKADHWRRFDAMARRYERQLAEVAARLFETDRRELAAILTETRIKAREDKATLDWQHLQRRWEEYVGDSAGMWAQALMPVLRAIMVDQGKELIATTGASFDLEDIRGADWFNDYVLRFATREGTQISETTKDQLAALLQQARLEGWSIPQVQRQLDATFGRFMGSDPPLSEAEMAWLAERRVPYRLENIARTETLRAANAGNYQMLRAWGVPRHEWLATMDDRVRDDHARANGQVVEVGKPFDVGGHKMLYPGDPDAPPEESCNCRCTTLPCSAPLSSPATAGAGIEERR